MGNRAKVTVDWLRKGRMVEDLVILQNLITDSSVWEPKEAKLAWARFESEFNLQPIPKEATTEGTLDRVLGYEEVTDKITTKMSPLAPEGSTIEKQVHSLFPKNMSQHERDTLSYVFSRFVLEDTPNDIEWPITPVGLDSMSAALFTIYFVSRLIGGEIPWLLPIWQIKVEEHRIEGLQKIYDLLLSDLNIENVIEKIEEIKNSIKAILITNPKVKPPEDPLSDKTINGWLNTLKKEKESSRRVIDKTRSEIVAEVWSEIILRKGAGLVSQEEIDLQKRTLTLWNILALRPDGPLAAKHEPILKMYRGSINILDYEPLVRICEILSESERAGRPVASEVDSVTGTKRRMAHYTLHRLGLVLTERYIPTMTKLGLRYRFIFTETQKPSIVSDGLIERMILSESSHNGCTVHLEPISSQGPSNSISPNCIQMTVDSEIVSMRMDLYDKKNKTWLIEPWKPASKSPGRSPSWLYRDVGYDEESPVKLTRKQIDFLGPLLTFRGLRSSRMWFMERLGFVPKTTRNYLRKMLNEKILRLLYSPALEFCGLPEGMLIAGDFKKRQSRESFINWMTSRIPFVHVFKDSLTKMVAYIRLPPYKTDVVGGVIREKLSEGPKNDSTSNQSIIARLRSYKTYQMTAFQRIYQKNEFIDPWDN